MRITVEDEITIPNPDFSIYYPELGSAFDLDPATGAVSNVNKFASFQDFENTQFSEVTGNSWVSGWLEVVPGAIKVQVYVHSSENNETFLVYMWKTGGRIVSSGIHSGGG